MRQSHHLVRNALANVAGQLAVFAPGFVIPPFVITRIGPESYGLVVVLMALLSFVGLVNLGIPEALSRFLAVECARGDTTGLSRVYSTGGAFLGLAALVAGLAVLAIAARPDWFVAVPESVPLDTVRVVAMLVGIANVLTVLTTLGTAAFYARERFALLNALRSAEPILRLVLVLLLVGWWSQGLVGYAASGATAMLLTSVAILVLGRQLLPEARLERSHVRWDSFRRLAGFGSEVALNRLALLLYLQVDYLIIGRAFGPNSVTTFSLAIVWSQLVRGLVGAAVAVVSPSAAIRHEHGDSESLRVMLLRSAKYGLLASAPPLVFLLTFRFQLLETWMGPGYEHTAELMLILLIPDFLVAATQGPVQLFVGLGKVRFFTVTNAIFGALNAILALGLGVLLELELWGIALATLIVFSIRFGILLPVYMARHLGVRPFELYRRSYVGPTLTALALVPVALGIQRLEIAEGWLGLLTAAALLGAAAVPIAWILAFDGYDRRIARELAGQAARMLRGAS